MPKLLLFAVVFLRRLVAFIHSASATRTASTADTPVDQSTPPGRCMSAQLHQHRDEFSTCSLPILTEAHI